VVATRSPDGKYIFIKAVNTDPARPFATKVSLSGGRVAPTAEIESVTAPSLSAANSFSTPEAVSVKRSEVTAGSAFDVQLPARSVSVITLNVEN
jgi:alpha-L-arabinofuranosidase